MPTVHMDVLGGDKLFAKRFLRRPDNNPALPFLRESSDCPTLYRSVGLRGIRGASRHDGDRGGLSGERCTLPGNPGNAPQEPIGRLILTGHQNLL